MPVITERKNESGRFIYIFETQRNATECGKLHLQFSNFSGGGPAAPPPPTDAPQPTANKMLLTPLGNPHPERCAPLNETQRDPVWYSRTQLRSVNLHLHTPRGRLPQSSTLNGSASLIPTADHRGSGV